MDRYTEEQKTVLNQILLQTVTEAPTASNRKMDVLLAPHAQKKQYRGDGLAFKKQKAELKPDDKKLLRVTVPVTDGQTAILNSSGDAASKVLNQAFGDYLAPDSGEIKILVAAANTPTAKRQNGADIINLGSFTMDMTASAYKSLAIKALTRLADPKEGAAMLGISADDYKEKLESKDAAIARKIGEVLTNAGFIKNEQQVADLVKTVTDAQQFEFAAVLNDAVAQLPEMQATATAADKITRGRTSASRPGNIIT